ncbi:MAG: major tail protein [Bacteriophage sp.]|nr:MAG: major tail protein [Bacteriophage sp.]
MINLPVQGGVAPRNPETKLRLYSGVPWSDEYEHVRLYNSKAELLDHLESYRRNIPSVDLSHLAPIRVGNYDIRVPFTEMKALNLNYLAFQNAGISDEWVFCFIDSIEWLSEKTTRINFSLDVFQNNFYNTNIKPCFVEYHHIPRREDGIGVNLVPVNLEAGETIVSQHKKLNLTPTDCCIFVTRGTVEQSWFDGRVENGVYCWGSIGHYDVTTDDGLEKINGLLKKYNDQGAQDAVIGLFMAPKLCIGALGGKEIKPKTTSMQISNNAFEGYKPKNKKLYSYPWLYCLADNNQGNTHIYRYEYSYNQDKSINFDSYGTIATLPQVLTAPKNYKTRENLPHGLMNEALINSSFPMCSFSSDTYRAWLAQNKSSIALSQVQTAVNSTIGLGTSIAGLAGGSLQGGINGLSKTTSAFWDALGMLANQTDRSRNAGVTHGKALSENVMTGIKECGVDFYEMSCKRQFAEMADSFFEQFGYPINKITMPNLRSRSRWNYVKTSHCGFTGNIDLDQLKKLRNIFDNGVTLWHTDDIGNYSLSNN